jgi:protein-S-isoprenylcysteine O-methyltransferase Ste14
LSSCTGDAGGERTAEDNVWIWGAAVLMIVRTILEDRVLQAELPGYNDYASKVHYCLVPGIW